MGSILPAMKSVERLYKATKAQLHAAETERSTASVASGCRDAVQPMLK